MSHQESAYIPDEDDSFSADYLASLKAFKDQSNALKRKAIEAETTKKIAATTALKKSFIADNGIKYVWDEEEDDWVEGNDDSDYDDEEVDENEEEDNPKPQGSNEPAKQKRIRKNKNKKKKVVNNWVYVTGLPIDVTEDEIKDHFSKVGMIAMNPADQSKKIKIYKDADGLCKGDGSVCYACPESVKMAIDILHEGYIRPNNQLQVTAAEFNVPSAGAGANKSSSQSSQNHSQHGGERRPALTKAQINVANSARKQALTWNDEGDAGLNKSKALKIVVIQGMFHPRDLNPRWGQQLLSDDLDDNEDNDRNGTSSVDKSVNQAIKELEEDIVEECTSKCGMIDKITVFSKNPKGIVVVKFTTAFAADACIKLMDGRWYDKSKLKCFYFDGVTNYSITTAQLQEDTSHLDEKRLEAFGTWLEDNQQELPEEFRIMTEE